MLAVGLVIKEAPEEFVLATMTSHHWVASTFRLCLGVAVIVIFRQSCSRQVLDSPLVILCPSLFLANESVEDDAFQTC